jgi:DNA polymerase-3 subunit alpha
LDSCKKFGEKVVDLMLAQQGIKPFQSFEDFYRRVPISLEQIIILIRLGAFRFLDKKKKICFGRLIIVIRKEKERTVKRLSFEVKEETLELPHLDYHDIEDIYDTVELLGFYLEPPFSVLRNPIEIPTRAKDFPLHLHKTITILGYLVNVKFTRPSTQERMAFGYFIDEDGAYFDTVQFPKILKQYPFQGAGIYLLKGKVTEEFGHFALQIVSMEKQHLAFDPRYF